MSAHVLVVDDDEHIRRSLTSALTRAGYTVTSAADGVPAMALADGSDRFAIVVADYNMKTASGADVVRHFKARFGSQVFCVVLSGEEGGDAHDACVAAGADAVLAKPAPLAVLRKLLNDAAQALSAA
jgi:CheY-like chemotaxis protein